MPRPKPDLTPDQLKVRSYLYGKRSDAKSRDIGFDLTREDIETMLTEAGITIYDVGNGAGAYCLGRYGDTGPYAIGNCRFITHRENGREWWYGMSIEEQEQRKAQARENGKKGAKYGHLGGYQGSSAKPQKTIR